MGNSGSTNKIAIVAAAAGAAVVAGGLCSLCSSFGSVPNSHHSGGLDSVQSSSCSVPNSQDSGELDSMQSSSGSVPNSQDSGELDSVQSSSGSVPNFQDFGELDSVQSSSGSVPNSQDSGELDSVQSNSASVPNSHDSGLIDLPSGSGSASAGGSGFIGWQFPPMGWIKCNVDGSCRKAQRSAGCGGVYRDGQGKWVNGFARKLAYCSAMKAETLAIFTGLAEAWRLGFRKLIIESDSNSAVDLVNKDVSASHNLAWPVKKARKYLRKEWQVNIVYLPREYNRAADWLSKFSHELQVGVHELKKPPTKGFSKILLKDECQALCLPTFIVS